MKNEENVLIFDPIHGFYDKKNNGMSAEKNRKPEMKMQRE